MTFNKEISWLFIKFKHFFFFTGCIICLAREIIICMYGSQRKISQIHELRDRYARLGGGDISENYFRLLKQ